VFQFIEGLSDRQAAEAVRSRIDWKYALDLDLADPGFDFVRHVTWQSITDAIGT
jgi:transposase